MDIMILCANSITPSCYKQNKRLLKINYPDSRSRILSISKYNMAQILIGNAVRSAMHEKFPQTRTDYICNINADSLNSFVFLCALLQQQLLERPIQFAIQNFSRQHSTAPTSPLMTAQVSRDPQPHA